MSDIQHIRLKHIRRPKNVFRLVDTNSLQYLTLLDSIEENGVLSPIVVRPASRRVQERYEIIEGLHRFVASQELGLISIPAMIVEADDDLVLDLQMQLNFLRPETKPCEIARRLKRIMAIHPGMTIGGLSTRIKMSRSWISKYLKLNKLHPQVQRAIDSGQVPIESGAMIAKLRHDDQLTYLTHARQMPTREFKPLIAAVINEKRERRQVERFTKRWEMPFTPVPYVRTVREIARQIEKTRDIELPDGISPIEAAREALKWAIHLDPKSAKAQRDKARRRGQAIAAV